MLTDSLLTFVSAQGAPLTMVGGAGVNIVVGQVIDLLGEGVGLAPVNYFGTTISGFFGTDFGVGVKKALLDCVVGTAFATGNSATWNLAWQFAPDTGAAGNYQPGTWATVIETGAQAVANAPAGAVIGRFDLPPALPPGLNPRFMRLLMQFVSGTNLSAGTISFAGLTTDRDDQSNRFAARNFSVS